MDPTGPQRVFLYAACLHCKPSEVLSSQLIDYLRRNGHELVDTLAEADLIVVNTCGYDDPHERISMQLFAKAYSGRSPRARVVSIGCLNRIDSELLLAAYPDLDLVDDLEQLDAALARTTPASEIREAVCDATLYRDIHYLTEPEDTESVRTRAFFAAAKTVARVSRRLDSERLARLHLDSILEHSSYQSKLSVQIGSGCAGRCSYCVIKRAKGQPRSRPIADIVADVEARRGSNRLLQLVADDCGSFGADTGETLFDLVDALARRFPDLPLNLTYVNPSWLDGQADAYLTMFTRARISSVNLSLQSGSDRLLREMNRHYAAGDVVRFIDRLAEVSPGTMVYTHLLLGFPGETWSDFWQTARAARPFHYITCFLYTPRKGTPAYSLRDDVPHAVKVLRKRIIHSMYVGRIVGRVALG